MEEDLEKIIALAGNKNRYQFFIVTLSFLFWMNINFFSITLPYLEQTYLISYYDKDSGETKVESISYDICENKEMNYEIVKYFNNSWVIEQKLECSKFLTGLIGSFTFTGNTLGAILYPIFSKFLSQKKILMFGTLLLIVFMTLSIFINEYIFYFAILILGNIGCNLTCYSSLTLTQEVTINHLRGIFGGILNFGFSICGIFYSLLFMNINDWKYIFLICIIFLVVLCIISLFLVSEAPRTCLNKNFEDFIETVEKISEFNGKYEEFTKKIQEDKYIKILEKLKGFEFDYSNKENETEESDENNENFQEEENLRNPNLILIMNNNIMKASERDNSKSSERIQIMNPLNELQINKEREKINDKINKKEKKKKSKISYLALIKYPSIRYKFIIMSIIWFFNQGIYSGLNIGIKSLPGNIYINGIIGYSSDIISYIVGPIIIEIKYFGRKKTGIYSYIFSTIFLIILLIFINYDTLSIIIYFIVHFFVAIPYSIFFTYCLEIYPTVIRHIGFGLNATMGNIGGIVVPLVIEYLPRRVIYLVYAILTGICSFLFLFLEETLGKNLPETIKEVEEEKKKKKEKRRKKNQNEDQGKND